MKSNAASKRKNPRRGSAGSGRRLARGKGQDRGYQSTLLVFVGRRKGAARPSSPRHWRTRLGARAIANACSGLPLLFQPVTIALRQSSRRESVSKDCANDGKSRASSRKRLYLPIYGRLAGGHAAISQIVRIYNASGLTLGIFRRCTILLNTLASALIA